MSESLTSKHCVPCEGGVPPLTMDETESFLKQVNEDWKVEDNRKVKRTFIFDDFKQAMDFVNKVAELAEDEGHHPDVYIYYSKVEISLWTHAIGGLSENDFILAAKIDEIA